MSARLNTHFGSTLLATVLIVGAAAGAQENQIAEVSTESYGVYSAVLTQQYRSWFKGKEPVLIIAHTVLEPQGHAGYERCRAQVEQDAVVRELLDRLLAERREFRIEARLRLPGTYKMLRGKANISENHEPGIVFLSVVEFSKDRSRAIVLVGHRCGGLCGDGLVRTLDKRIDGWHLTKDQPNCGWVN